MTLNDFWVWTYAALGSAAARRLIAHYGSPLTSCKAGRNEWVSSGIVSESDMEKAMRINPVYAQSITAECEKKNWSIILPGSEYYPELLAQIKDYPVILFVNGNAGILCSRLMIASVGTRNSSAQGEYLAYRMCRNLSAAGAVTVSGGALGIDSSSHSGALDAGAGTIAVLGCGLGSSYLKANENLRSRITENGALVTEYLPDEGAKRINFPRRNRIISGMCRGTVVTEASVNSGSLITARYAKKQGRDVFVFPGVSGLPGFDGSDLLLSEGASPVTSAYDVIKEYDPSLSADRDPYLCENILSGMPAAPERKTVKKSEETVNHAKISEEKKEEKKDEKKPERTKLPVPENLSVCAKKLYEYIALQPVQTDTAAIKAGLGGSELMCALTELELAGIIRQLPGNRCVAEQ